MEGGCVGAADWQDLTSHHEHKYKFVGLLMSLKDSS